MKKKVFTLIFMLFFAFSTSASVQSEKRLITVTGDAEIAVVPDEVVINLSVEKSSGELSDAKEQSSEVVKKIMGVAKKYTIDPKNARNDINIQPKYQYNEREPMLAGYSVRQTIVVILKDISKYEEFIGNIMESGVNYVYTQFRNTELKKYKDQARTLAIRAAQEKANTLAKELGVKIARPYSAIEDSCGSMSLSSARRGGYMMGDVFDGAQYESMGSMTMPSENVMVSGQIIVKSKVTVSFEIE